MSDSTLNIEINQSKAIKDLAKLDDGLKKATKSGDKLSKSTKKTGEDAQTAAGGFKFLGAAIAAAFSASALTGLAKTIAAFETLEYSLGVVFQSMGRGKEVFKDIQVLAETTPFAIEDLTTSVIKLRAAGIEPTKAQLTLFSDTASVTTDAVGSLVAITDLFSRTTAGGLGLMDLNRLADRGIPVFDILSQKLGLARLEVVKFGRDAQGSAIILEALTEGLQERFGGASLASTQNLTTAISNLGDTFDGMLKAIGDAGALEMFKFLTFQATAAVEWFGENLDTVAVAIAGLSTLAIPALIAGVKSLTLALAANPIGLLVVAITAAVTAAYYFRDVIYDTIVRVFSVSVPNAMDHTLVAFHKVKLGIYDLVNVVLKSIEDLGNKMIEKTPDFLKGWLGIEGAKFSFGIDTQEVTGRIDELLAGIESRINNYKPPKRPDFFNTEDEDDVSSGEDGLSDGDSLTGNRINAIQKQNEVLSQKQIEAAQSSLERLEFDLLTEEEKLWDSYGRKMDMVLTAHENELITEEKRTSLLSKLETKFQTDMTALLIKEMSKRQAFAAKSTTEQTKQVLGEMINMTAGVAQHNKAMFEINKAAGIASAIINTWQGASRTMAEYPYPLNVALASLSVAAGMAQVSAIAGTTFGGSGSGSGNAAPSGVTGGGGAPNSDIIQPVSTGTTDTFSGPTEINITVDGTGQLDRDQAEEIARSLRDYLSDGGEVIAA